MAYDKALADRVRRALKHRSEVEERAMFGGVAFMVRGHMCCGLVEDRLVVRVRPDAYEELLGEPGAQPMDFTGRPMRGFLYVSGAGTATPSALRTWVTRALDFAERRPVKASRAVRTNSTGRSKGAQGPAGRSMGVRPGRAHRGRPHRG